MAAEEEVKLEMIKDEDDGDGKWFDSLCSAGSVEKFCIR